MEALASHDYKAFEADQLSFKQGDVIKILKEVNSDWFDAELKGNSGVVPANHIVFEPPKWYEVVSKERAVSILTSRGPRDTNFLVRPSEATPGEMSLSVKTDEVQHFKILRDQSSKYFIWNDAPHFNSINELTTHYKTTSASRTDHVILREGGVRGRGAGGYNATPAPTRPAQRTVTAKFDFVSRNNEELTIYEGEVITVVEEVDGIWLKGSLNRNGSLLTGLFPANYV